MISYSWILTVLIYFTKFYNVEAKYTCQVVKESGPFVKFQLEWHLPQHSTNRYVKFADNIHSACSAQLLMQYSLWNTARMIYSTSQELSTPFTWQSQSFRSLIVESTVVFRGLLLPSKFLKWFHPFPKKTLHFSSAQRLFVG